MKRDLNLIRELLLIIENADTTPSHRHVGINSSLPRVQHHLRLLVDAGLVRGVGETADGSISVRLTWKGYEFLELVRDNATWQRVQSFVQHKTRGLNMDVLQTVLHEQAKQSVQQIDRWRADYHTRRSRVGSENGDGSGDTSSQRERLPLPGASADTDRTPSVRAPINTDAAHFQFHIWNGEAESLPVYLL